MKQKDIIKAFHALQKYEEKDLPIRISYSLFKVKKLIEDQVEFQLNAEQEIFQKYKPTSNEDGSLKFESEEQAREFAQEFSNKIDEIGEIEVELDLKNKPKISLDQIVDMSIEDIEALEPFIEFTE